MCRPDVCFLFQTLLKSALCRFWNTLEDLRPETHPNCSSRRGRGRGRGPRAVGRKSRSDPLLYSVLFYSDAV